jgi:hypothetical protein
VARFSLTWKSINLDPFADTTALTDSDYAFLLQGGNGTQVLKISELFIGGEATASAVVIPVLARDSTVGATVTAGTCRNTNLDATSTAPGTLPVFGHSATTDPQRANLHLLTMSFNPFGGVVRWVARQGEELVTVGASANTGEVSLSGFTGSAASGGPTSGHCIYELA